MNEVYIVMVEYINGFEDVDNVYIDEKQAQLCVDYYDKPSVIKNISIKKAWYIKRNLFHSKEEKPTESNNVINPNHYDGLHGITVRQVQENFAPKYAKYGGTVVGDMMNVIKYGLRAPEKNGLEDLKKMRVNLDWSIEGIEEYENNLLSRSDV